MNWRVFYAVMMWTLLFWAQGRHYTIVPGRHIGLDIGTGRRAVNVPCLHPGTVVLVTKTVSMGYVIYVDTGLPGARRYHVYCHMSGDRLPARGQRIGRNERIGRLAAFGGGSDKDDVPFSHIDYGGTAWDGIHLHLVMTDRIGGAHLRNTGAAFANPETFIREALAGTPASTDSRPFVPEEEDDMYDDKAKKDAAERHEAVIARLDQIARIAAPFRKFQWGTGLVVVNPTNGRFWILPQGYAELLDKLDLAEGQPIELDDAQLGFVTGFLPAAIGDVAPQVGDGFTGDDLDAIRRAIAESAITLSQAQYDQLVAAVVKGAREGGEDGARRALDDLTLVVKAG